MPKKASAKRSRKGFTPPKKGKMEVAYETVSRPFQHLKGAKKGILSKVGKALS